MIKAQHPFVLFRGWLVLAVGITLLCGITYFAVHHQARTMADDPQIQMAEDTAALLGNGTEPQQLHLEALTQVDIANSLAPFLIVYGADGKVVVASGYLNGGAPIIPSGVLDFTKVHGEDRITWQPQSSVRIATVVKRYEGNQPGFVLAGRSLKEVEVRASDLGIGMLIGWLVTLAFTFAAAYILSRSGEESAERAGV